MDTLILGLLILQSRTVYEIKARISKGLNMMYSDSMGSIQSAIKKLLSNGYIEYVEFVENGKYKKKYSITPLGRDYFNQWINMPIKASQNKGSELAKLYFMGFSEKETRIKRMEEYIQSLTEAYNIMKLIYDEGKIFKMTSENIEIANYQLISAKYGVDTLKFHIDWYINLLNDMKEGKI